MEPDNLAGNRKNKVGGVTPAGLFSWHIGFIRHEVIRLQREAIMTHASILREKAEMFEQRAESAADPVSKQHYRELAAECRRLLVEHLNVQSHETAD